MGCKTSTSHHHHGTIWHKSVSMLRTSIVPAYRCFSFSYAFMPGFVLAPGVPTLKVIVVSKLHFAGQFWIATPRKMRAYCKTLAKRLA